MKRINNFFVSLFILIVLSHPISAQEIDLDSMICQLNNESVRVTLPPDFIAKVKMSVQFAFEQKSAYAVSLMDLNHFHLLVLPTIENVNWLIEKKTKRWSAEEVLRHIQISKALILHSQEITRFTDHIRKRNIFLAFEKGTPEILDPAKYGKGYPYVIDLVDLKMDNLTYANQECLFDITGMENKFEKEIHNTFKVKSLLSKERTILIRFLK